MTDWTDRPQPVRPGEDLPIAPLRDYLRAQLGIAGDLVVEQFPKGYSNLTYLLRLGEQELVLRRPPFGANIRSAHDMGREYAVLSRLHPVYGKVPRPLCYYDDADLIGAPFYVMERVRGVILRADMPAAMTPPPALMRRIGESLVAELAALHALDLETAGLRDFGKPDGYVARQVHGWARRYADARTDEIPDMEVTAVWLAEHMPPESGAALIHNDFKFDNCVLDPQDWTRITAVLDWEMATVGDPLMDLGAALGYWVQPDDPPALAALALSPTTRPGNLTRAEVVARYAARSGRSVEQIDFYLAFGFFRLGVIAQQIYRRWKLGHTRDPRFAALIDGVRACGAMARATAAV